VVDARCFGFGLCFCLSYGFVRQLFGVGSSDAEELVSRWSHCHGWWLLFGLLVVLLCYQLFVPNAGTFSVFVRVVRDQRLGG